MEKWLPIKRYEEKYFISDEGRVYSVRAKRLIKPYRNSKEYLQIGLCRKKFLVHRLVAIHFLPNPDDLPEVNHINGRQQDNRVLNLEWCTTEYNLKHEEKLAKWRKIAWERITGIKSNVF